MTDKQIKEEIKQVVTNLGNIEFTVEDELKFCKEILKRKEQECERLKEKYLNLKEQNGNNIVQLNTVNEQLNQLKEKNKWYDHYKESALRNKELYNDLSTKYDQLKAENEELKETISDKEKWLSEIDIKNSEYWKEKYADLHIRYGNRIEELKQALSEIKEVIKQEGYINKKTQIFKGSILYQAMEDLKLPDKKILKIIERVLDV